VNSIKSCWLYFKTWCRVYAQ